MLIPRCDGMPKIPSAEVDRNVWEPFYKRAPENRTRLRDKLGSTTGPVGPR